MSGIILLTVLALWFFIATKITGFLTSKIYLKIKGKWIYSMVFILVFIAPVMDEIIGGFQFRALCTPENLLIYDADKVRGKTVRFKDLPDYSITNKIIPIQVVQNQWIDTATNETLITRKIFYASGGWLSRFVGFPQGSPPYTFNGKCSSKKYYPLFKKLNITKIES